MFTAKDRRNFPGAILRVLPSCWNRMGPGPPARLKIEPEVSPRELHTLQDLPQIDPFSQGVFLFYNRLGHDILRLDRKLNKQRGNEDIKQGKRNQPSPPKAHNLIIPEPRQGPPDPHKHPQEEEYL